MQAIKNGQASIAINAFTYNTRVIPVASYVAQLIPLPDSFTERFDILSVLRCANCLRHSNMFELHKYGGPKIKSISVACTAALTRTALKTVTGWPDWVRQMQIAYNEFTALDHLRRPGQTTLSQATLCPDYCDSLPIALNLKDAYDGFPNSKKWCEGGAIINTKLLSMNKNHPIVPGCDFSMKSKGLQKFVYEQYMQCRFGLDFPVICKPGSVTCLALPWSTGKI